MSLINDALKKAQRQRTEGSTPATEISTPSDPQEPLHRVARREKPVGFRSQLILVAGGAVAAIVLLGVGAFFFFRPAAEPSVPASPHPTQVASAPAPAASAPVPATVAPTPPAPVSAPAAALPTVAIPAPVSPAQPAPTAVVVATPTSPAPVEPSVVPPATPAPASAPVSFSIPNPTPTVSSPAATSAPSATASASSERPKASTRMIGVIEHLKVGGIRVAGTESKVLMNDRVYRINDIVDFELGIRLTAIEAKALTFEDSRGAVHVRTF